MTVQHMLSDDYHSEAGSSWELNLNIHPYIFALRNFIEFKLSWASSISRAVMYITSGFKGG